MEKCEDLPASGGKGSSCYEGSHQQRPPTSILLLPTVITIFRKRRMRQDGSSAVAVRFVVVVHSLDIMM